MFKQNFDHDKIIFEYSRKLFFNRFKVLKITVIYVNKILYSIANKLVTGCLIKLNFSVTYKSERLILPSISIYYFIKNIIIKSHYKANYIFVKNLVG